MAVIVLALCAGACAQSPPSQGQASQSAAAQDAAELSRLSLPPVGLRPRDLAVVINDDDRESVEIGHYYAAKRGIPSDRVVHVRFPARPVVTMSA